MNDGMRLATTFAIVAVFSFETGSA